FGSEYGLVTLAAFVLLLVVNHGLVAQL
ncbi:hypothetical protein A2U01_0076942, partial [Trifolium medium]|nr:hypothetical protein [Trifolium medium]